MKYLHRLFAVASAAFFIAGSALAQNAGTVTNHAFALGKGAGTSGYTSLLCGSAQIAVGQAAADPICKTLTGDVTISAAGVTSLTRSFNVVNYGATNDCSTDSTTAINDAIVAARVASPSFGFLYTGSEVYFPPGIYCVSTIDATRTAGLTLRASPNTAVIYGQNQSTSRAIIDLTGSSAAIVNGIIVAGQTPGGTDPAVLPAAGFLLADTTAGGQCNKNRISNSGSLGKFTNAALYIYGCTDSIFDANGWQQDQLSAPVMFHSQSNDFGIASSYATIATTNNPTGENTFYSNEFHGARSASSTAPTVSLKDAYAVRFYGGNNDANGTTSSHYYFQGTNNAITVNGVQLYSENGTAAPYVFQSNAATINGLTVVGVHALSNAFSSAQFTGTGFTDPIVISSPGLTSINWPTIPNGYILGNVTGSTSAPVPISPAQMTTLVTALPLTQLATIPNTYMLGNVTGSTNPPAALSPAQITANLNSFTTALKGLVPASGGGTANFLRADGTFTTPLNASVTAPTFTTLTSGTAATYTTPAGVKWLKVRMVGGGGGGMGGGNSGTSGNGGNGTATVFGSFTCNFGTGAAGGASGTGGAAPAYGGNTFGFAGGNGTAVGATVAGLLVLGGIGGSSAFFTGNVQNASVTPNTGAGGGGGYGNGAGQTPGPGAGAGASLEAIITSPAATYTYTIGAGGTAGAAGTSGTSGFTGATGIIIVEEHYNY